VLSLVKTPYGLFLPLVVFAAFACAPVTYRDDGDRYRAGRYDYYDRYGYARDRYYNPDYRHGHRSDHRYNGDAWKRRRDWRHRQELELAEERARLARERRELRRERQQAAKDQREERVERREQKRQSNKSNSPDRQSRAKDRREQRGSDGTGKSS
jgi:hypothetical protein